jgi:phenylpropionate dioxygenase-like ring-hydroxylating dioxygenase large terminal subunit
MSTVAPTRAEIDDALRHGWFVVARSQDLDAPRPACLLGEELVVFRTEGGTPAVTSIRCPHRGGDLSAGSVDADCIVCPYHGWHWRGSDGVCVKIPALGPRDAIPSKAQVPAYPVRERWGLVWTCLDKPVDDLPVLPELDGLDLTFMCSQEIPQRCGIAAATENFRDVAHFPFVHRQSMGEIAHEVDPLEVRREETECWMSRRYLAAGGEGEAIWSNDEGRVTMSYHTVAPSFSCIVYDYEGLGKRVLLNTVQPVGLGGEGCVIRFVVGVDADFKGPSLEECVAHETVVYLEDQPILDGLRPHEVPFGEEIEFSTAADRYTVAFRRCFLEWTRRTLDRVGRPAGARVAAG